MRTRRRIPHDWFQGLANAPRHKEYTDDEGDWIGYGTTYVREMPSVLLREGEMLDETGGEPPTVELYTRHDAGKTETLRLIRKICTRIERHWPEDDDPDREESPDEEFLAEWPPPVVLCRESNGHVFVDGVFDSMEQRTVTPPGDLPTGGWADWIVSSYGDEYIGIVLEVQDMVKQAIASGRPVRDTVREAHQMLNRGDLRFWLEDAIQVQYRRGWNSDAWESILASPLLTGETLVYRGVGTGACRACARAYTNLTGALRLYTVAELERLSATPAPVDNLEECTARIAETHDGCTCPAWQLYKPFLAKTMAESDGRRREMRIGLGLPVIIP